MIGKSVELVINEMTNNAVNSPCQLNPVQINNEYDEMMRFYTDMYANKTLSEIKNCASKAQQLAKPAPQKAQLLALIRKAIVVVKEITPFATQMVSAIVLINGSTKQDTKGRIAQIGTGEGKSTVVAMLVVYFALQGINIDVITSNEYLADRDYKNYKELLEMFGIKSGCVCGDGEDRFKSQVLYGTNSDFEFAQQREKMFGYQILYGRDLGKTLVIIDEIDSLLIDSALNSSRLSIPCTDDISWVFEPIWLASQKSDFQGSQIKQISDVLSKFLGGKYKQQVLKISDRQLLIWKCSAFRASQLQENIDYLVHENNILIVSTDSGRISSKETRWEDHIHEFLEVKHGITPQNGSLMISSLTHSVYFSQYQRVIGLTGTIGEPYEREEIQKLYSVDSFDVPQNRASWLFPNEYQIYDDKDQTQQIINRLAEIINEKLQRCYLVMVQSIQESQQIYNSLLQLFPNHIQLLNSDIDRNYEIRAISLAGQPKMVTIATNVAGRGTDIKIDPIALHDGGLHVIFTFYPTNKRVEEQGIGRAGRMGQAGSYTFLLRANHQTVKNFLDRDKNMNQTMQKVMQNNTIKDDDKHRDTFEQLSKQRLEDNIISSTQRQQDQQKEHYLYTKFQQPFQIVISNIKANVYQFHKQQQLMPLIVGENNFEYKFWPFTTKTSDLIELLTNTQQKMKLLDGKPLTYIASFLAQDVFVPLILQEWARYFSAIGVYQRSYQQNNLDQYYSTLDQKSHDFFNLITPIQNNAVQYLCNWCTTLQRLPDPLLYIKEMQQKQPKTIFFEPVIEDETKEFQSVVDRFNTNCSTAQMTKARHQNVFFAQIIKSFDLEEKLNLFQQKTNVIVDPFQIDMQISNEAKFSTKSVLKLTVECGRIRKISGILLSNDVIDHVANKFLISLATIVYCGEIAFEFENDKTMIVLFTRNVDSLNFVDCTVSNYLLKSEVLTYQMKLIISCTKPVFDVGQQSTETVMSYLQKFGSFVFQSVKSVADKQFIGAVVACLSGSLLCKGILQIDQNKAKYGLDQDRLVVVSNDQERQVLDQVQQMRNVAEMPKMLNKFQQCVSQIFQTASEWNLTVAQVAIKKGFGQ